MTPSRRGFSLVEVTMSLGILAFGLVTMMGILPLGLNTMRVAADQQVQSNIVQFIEAEAKLYSYDQLTTGNAISNTTFYFDSEGLAASSENATFEAEVEISGNAFSNLVNASPRNMSTARVLITRKGSTTTKDAGFFHLANKGF
ncbi:MAG: Verru_Chthon cassette protein B [Verrucomicrobiota bacterium]